MDSWIQFNFQNDEKQGACYCYYQMQLSVNIYNYISGRIFDGPDKS